MEEETCTSRTRPTTAFAWSASSTLDNLLWNGISTYAGNGDPGAFDGRAEDGRPHRPAEWVDLRSRRQSLLHIGAISWERSTGQAISASLPARTSAQGNGTEGYSGDGGPATSATLSNPQGLASDLAGNIYIADTGNFVVRKVDTNGNISTVAGNHNQGNSGDGGMATDAEINAVGVSTDRAGELYITGGGTNPIRKVNSAGMISTFAGGGSGGASGPARAQVCPMCCLRGRTRFGNLLIPSGATVFSAGSEGTCNSETRVREPPAHRRPLPLPTREMEPLNSHPYPTRTLEMVRAPSPGTSALRRVAHARTRLSILGPVARSM